MRFTLVLDPRAEADMVAARADYDAEDPDVGRRFVAVIRDALDKIQAAPSSFPLITAEVRFFMPRRFPYVIYDRVDSDRVVVLAVVHKRQDQAQWKRRL